MADRTHSAGAGRRGKPPVKKKKTLGIVIGAVLHLGAIGILCWIIFGRGKSTPDTETHPELNVARNTRPNVAHAPSDTPRIAASTKPTPPATPQWDLPPATLPTGLRPLNTSPPDPAPPARIGERLSDKLNPLVRDFETKHAGPVFALAALPDGNHVLSGGADRRIRIWDSAKAREVRALEGTPHVVHSLAVRFDSAAAASGGDDGIVRIWDLGGAREAFALSGHKGKVRALAFSPNGQYVLSGGDDETIRLWEFSTREQVRELKYGQPVSSIAFGADGRRALIGGDRGTVSIYDLETGQPLHTLTGHIGTVTGVAFSPDGHEAASVGDDTTLRFWDVVNGTRIAIGGVKSQTAIRYSQPLRGVAYAGDGSWVVVALGDSAAAVVQPHGTGRARIALPDKGRPLSLAVAPNGSAAFLGTDQATVRRLDFQGGSEAVATNLANPTPPPTPTPMPPTPTPAVKTNTIAPKWTADAGSGTIRSLAIAANGRIVAGGTDRIVRIWEPESSKESHTLSNMTSADNNVAISRDGTLILLGGSSPEVVGRISVPADCVLRVVSVKNEKAAKVGIHSSPIGCLAMSQNGRYALTGCEKLMRFWDVSSAREIRQYVGHVANVKAVDFHPKTILAASVAGDNTAKIWDLQAIRLLKTIEVPGTPAGISFSPDGKTILVFGTGVVGTWDSTTGKSLKLFDAPGGKRGPDSLKDVAAAWAPNGNLLIAAGGNIALIDPETGKELIQFSGFTGAVSAVGVAADGRFVVAGGRGVALWELEKPLVHGPASESVEKSTSPTKDSAAANGKAGP